MSLDDAILKLKIIFLIIEIFDTALLKAAMA